MKQLKLIVSNYKTGAWTAQMSAENGADAWRTQPIQYDSCVCVMILIWIRINEPWTPMLNRITSKIWLVDLLATLHPSVKFVKIL